MSFIEMYSLAKEISEYILKRPCNLDDNIKMIINRILAKAIFSKSPSKMSIQENRKVFKLTAASVFADGKYNLGRVVVLLVYACHLLKDGQHFDYDIELKYMTDCVFHLKPRNTNGFIQVGLHLLSSVFTFMKK